MVESGDTSEAAAATTGGSDHTLEVDSVGEKTVEYTTTQFVRVITEIT